MVIEQPARMRECTTDNMLCADAFYSELYCANLALMSSLRSSTPLTTPSAMSFHTLDDAVLLYCSSKGNGPAFAGDAGGSDPFVVAVTPAAGISPLDTASKRPTRTVSIGTRPKKCRSFFRAMSSPPPLPKVSLISPQQGHAYPAMFSTRPMTGRASLRVNDKDLIVSFRAVVCGVVMRMLVGVVGRSVVGVNKGCRWVSNEMCSSEVPASSALLREDGGVCGDAKEGSVGGA